jgi:hypothetical protein
MVLQMDTVKFIPGPGPLFSFQTLTSHLASHYHLRLKFPSATTSAVDTSQKLWVLLTRHVTNTKENSDYVALRVESEFDRRISQQRIDQIAEAVSGLCWILAWANLSGVDYALSGLIHELGARVGKSVVCRMVYGVRVFHRIPRREQPRKRSERARFL